MRRAFGFLIWAVAFLLSLLTSTLLNDHFDRITRAHQILRYGEVPFRDFPDPGYFLTLYISAVGQWLSGGGVLGELMLSSAALATASTIAYTLARSISGSPVAGLLALALTCVFPARAYDWDKALFYTAGLALIWHYVEQPSRGRLAALAVVTAVAALCRYDNGLYLIAATIPALMFRQGSPLPASVAVLTWGTALAGPLLVAAIFIESTAGIGEAARQVVTYASIEGERSEMLTLPQLGTNAASILWISIVLVQAAALAKLVVTYRTHQKDATFFKVASALILLLCVSLFVLRDPIDARVGAAVPLAAVLGAFVLPRQSLTLPRAVLFTAGVLVTAVIVFAAGSRLLRAPGAVVRRTTALTAATGAQGPRSVYFPGRGMLSGLAAYLTRCTGPQQRVWLTWYAPEVYFFAQRGFAAGMPVMLGTHWSSAADQQRAIERLQRHDVPLIVMSNIEGVDLDGDFSLLASYVHREYRAGGASTFGDARVSSTSPYTVLVRRTLPASLDPEWQVACPAPHPHS